MKRMKLLITSLLSLGLSLPFLVSSQSLNASSSLPSEAHIGDHIDFPNETLTYNGETKNASTRYVSPQGGTYSSSFLDITSAGKYTIEYFASFGEHEEVKSYDILSLRHSGDLFSSSGAAYAKNSSFSLDPSIKGVGAYLGSGGSLSFEQTLDLSKATKNDLLAEILIDPSSQGSSDLTRLTLTLTDEDDVNNNLYITLNDSTLSNCDGQGTYVKTGANTQTLAGYEGTSLKTNIEFGTPIHSSFLGLPANDPNRLDHTIKLYFDASELAVYASSSWLGAPAKRLVADLDAPSDFPHNLWKGFTNNKAKLSLSASGLYSVEAKALLLRIGSYDLSLEDQRDEVAPTLTIDYRGEEGIPSAVSGSSYRLFDASASDEFDGAVDVKTSISFQSSDLSIAPNDVSAVNGSILTSSPGTYSVTYKASDLSGNEAKKTIDISCSYASNPIYLYSKQEDLTVSQFSAVSLLPLKETSGSGGSGKLAISLLILDPSDHEVSYEVKDDGSISFQPSMTGTYKLVYMASDYLGQVKNLVKKVTVTPLSKACFLSPVVLPRVLISGFSYDLPNREGKAPGADNVAVDASVSVSVNDIALPDFSFTASGKEAKITYTVGEGSSSYSETTTVPVIDTNSGRDQAAYFYGNFSATEKSESLVLSAAADAYSLFANPLDPTSFTLEFLYDKDTWNFSTLTLAFASKDKSEEMVSLDILKDETGLVLSNNGESVALPDNSGFVRLSIDLLTGSVYSYKGVSIITIGKFDNGSSFSGFSSSIYFSIAGKGLSGSSALEIKKINNQPLGYWGESIADGGDYIAPTIVFEDDFTPKNTMGSSLSTPRITGYDVLSDIASLTLSAYDPNGTKVLDEVDGSEAHSLSLSLLGNYTLRYKAIDGNGNESSSPKVAHVTSDPLASKPSLSIEKMASSVKKGTAVTLPSYMVSDDSGHYSLNVILILPSNERRLLLTDKDGTKTSYLDNDHYSSSFVASSSSFFVEEEGQYTIRYVASDSDYNLTVAEAIFEAN